VPSGNPVGSKVKVAVSGNFPLAGMTASQFPPDWVDCDRLTFPDPEIATDSVAGDPFDGNTCVMLPGVEVIVCAPRLIAANRRTVRIGVDVSCLNLAQTTILPRLPTDCHSIPSSSATAAHAEEISKMHRAGARNPR